MNSSKFKSELFKLAFFPKYNDVIKNLAENIADKEEWNHPGAHNYSILKNYLEFTYRKLKQEKKISYTSDISTVVLIQVL